MQNLGIFKADKLIATLNYVGLPLAALYVTCMFIIPLVQSAGDWAYLQGVWDRWQSLNVGMLAFISSIIAFNISRFNAEKQRERDFLASKAFLPEALSELTTYCRESALLLNEGWGVQPGSSPTLKVPELPKEYKSIFGECIRHAEPEVGDYLSQILVWLQVHDSRIRSYAKQYHSTGQFQSQKSLLITYFFKLGELQAMVNKLFDFARNMAEFDSRPLKWKDFHTAYANLDIWEEKIRISDNLNLETHTKKALSGDES